MMGVKAFDDTKCEAHRLWRTSHPSYDVDGPCFEELLAWLVDEHKRLQAKLRAARELVARVRVDSSAF